MSSGRVICRDLVQYDKYRRSNGELAFSTNESGEVWVVDRGSPIPVNERDYVDDPWLSLLAHCLRQIRNVGGRFFINREGAYYKDWLMQSVYFVRFRSQS